MNPQDQIRNPIEELAEEFMQRRRRGERPNVEEYQRAHPELAKQIADLFPTLEMMESVREDVDDQPRPVEDMPTEVGQRLGDFQILREIGRGGMGVVYEAHQVSLSRRVAVKVLAPSLQSNRKYLTRFQREARAAANLQHSNIVPVYGVASEGGNHFYVMQFIHGRGLDEVLDELVNGSKATEFIESLDLSADGLAGALRTGKFQKREFEASDEVEIRSLIDTNSHENDETDRSSVTAGSDYFMRIARLGCQAANGLEHAHRNGVCHRDIKPGNLLLDIFGNIWITDFGLVKLTGEESLTETGDIVGTLRYMAPECLRGEFDARSDVYGLGLTLYELLAQRKAFSADNRVAISQQITQTGPKSLSLSIPKDLRIIVHKAIDIEPAHRYSTARELADDLQRYLNGETILARQASWVERLWRWSKRNRSLAAAVSAAVLLLIGGLLGSIAFSLKLNKLANENHSAFVTAANESHDAKLRLFESNILRAEGWAGSGLQGQRELGLQAIREAIPLAKELNLGQGAFDRLRNAAISSLTSSDVQPVDEWDVCDNTLFPATFDANLETYVVSPEMNSTFEVRRVADHGLLSKLTIKQQAGWEIWLSGNGKYLASRFGGQQEGVVVVDVHSGDEVIRVNHMIRSLNAISFSQNSERIALGTVDGQLRVFDLTLGEEVYRADITADVLVFDQHGRLIVCREEAIEGNVEGEVIVDGGDPETTPKSYVAEFITVDDGKVARRVKLAGKARFACCGPRNLFAVICDVENQFRDEFSSDQDRPPRILEVYQFPGSKPILVLDDHLQKIRTMKISGDGRVVALGNLSSTELRDVRTGARLITVKGRILGFGDGLIAYRRFKKLGIQKLVLSDIHHGLARKQTWQHVKFHPSNEFFVSPDKNGVRFFSLDGRLIHQLPGYHCYGAAFTPDGSRLYWTYWCESASRYKLVTCGIDWKDDRLDVNEIEEIEIAPNFQPHHLAIDGNGEMLASDDKVRGFLGVKYLKEDREPIVIRGQRNPLFVSISPDRRWAAMGTWHGNSVAIFDLIEKRLTREVSTGITEVRFANDSKTLVCGNGQLINVETGQQSQVFSNEMEVAFDSYRLARKQNLACFSAIFPFGKLLLVDTNSWRTLAQIHPSPQSHSFASAISDDGRYLVVNSLEGDLASLYLWDLQKLNSKLRDLGLDWKMSSSSGQQN